MDRLQLEEHVASGYRLLKEKELKKGHFVFWTGRAKSILTQLLGIETEFIKDLDLYFKKIRETEPSVDQFEEKSFSYNERTDEFKSKLQIR